MLHSGRLVVQPFCRSSQKPFPKTLLTLGLDRLFCCRFASRQCLDVGGYAPKDVLLHHLIDFITVIGIDGA